MKIIHIPFCFHPDPVGGTEVYVQSLAQQLQMCVTEVLVVAPGRVEAIAARYRFVKTLLIK
jgi:hypothetical protein